MRHVVFCVGFEVFRVAGDCGWCSEWAPAGHEQRIRLDVDVLPFAGPWSDSYVARLRWAPNRDDVSSGRAQWRRLTAIETSFRVELGPLRGWPTDEVCFQATVIDPGGLDADGPVQCLALAPDEPIEERPRPEEEPEEEQPDPEEEVPPALPDPEEEEEEEPPVQPEPAQDDPQAVPDEGHDTERARASDCSATPRGGSTPWALRCLLGGLAVRSRRRRGLRGR